jgi:hypothetical protein
MKAIRELRTYKTAIVTGVAANTNMAIAGLSMDDTILSAIQVAGTVAAAPIDRTAATSITSAGNIQCTAATNGTTGAVLVVTYVTRAI